MSAGNSDQKVYVYVVFFFPDHSDSLRWGSITLRRCSKTLQRSVSETPCVPGKTGEISPQIARITTAMVNYYAAVLLVQQGPEYTHLSARAIFKGNSMLFLWSSPVQTPPQNQEPLNAPFLNGLFSSGFSRGKTAPWGEIGKRPTKVGKRPIKEGKRSTKAMVMVGISTGCLMDCFRAPPPWRKTAPLKRSIKRSMTKPSPCSFHFLYCKQVPEREGFAEETCLWSGGVEREKKGEKDVQKKVGTVCADIIA